MPLLKKTSTWNAGYAMPANVYAEGDDIQVSPQAPNFTYDLPPRRKRGNPWWAGYAVPRSVLAETPGQAVTVSPMMKRGTTLAKPASPFASPLPAEFQAGMGSLGDYGGGSLGPSAPKGRSGSLGGGPGGSLGGHAAVGDFLGGTSDPIAQFGREASAAIMSEVKAVAPSQRADVLRTVLDALDPAINRNVEATLSAARRQGEAPARAVDRAVAAALANHFTEQLIRVGSTGAVPKTGALGLAAYETTPQASLGNWLDSVGRGIKSAAGAVYSASSSALDHVGSLACKASKSGVLDIAATGAGLATGGPAAATAAGKGAAIAANACGKGTPAVTPPVAPYVPPASSGISPLLIFGGLGLAAVLILTRK